MGYWNQGILPGAGSALRRGSGYAGPRWGGGPGPYLKCSPSARMVSCWTPPMRLKKMARCPPSTVGRSGTVSAQGGGAEARGKGGLTDEDGLADAVGQGAGAQQQLEGGANAPRPGRQPPRQVLQVLRHGRAAPLRAPRREGHRKLPPPRRSGGKPRRRKRRRPSPLPSRLPAPSRYHPEVGPAGAR